MGSAPIGFEISVRCHSSDAKDVHRTPLWLSKSIPTPEEETLQGPPMKKLVARVVLKHNQIKSLSCKVLVHTASTLSLYLLGDLRIDRATLLYGRHITNTLTYENETSHGCASTAVEERFGQVMSVANTLCSR